jgi:hypothetical protein
MEGWQDARLWYYHPIQPLIPDLGTFMNGMGTFEGEFYKGRKKGKGLMTYHDGSIYDGHWVEDRPHGSGVYENPRGYVTRYIFDYLFAGRPLIILDMKENGQKGASPEKEA